MSKLAPTNKYAAGTATAIQSPCQRWLYLQNRTQLWTLCRRMAESRHDKEVNPFTRRCETYLILLSKLPILNMDKLYYIVCEEKNVTLFEGKFQGRTRGAAIKFLKEQIGRENLIGTVFTITDIPVPLIREIVESILKGQPFLAPAPIPFPAPATNPVKETKSVKEAPQPEEPKAGQPDWKAVKRFYGDCHSPKQTAEKFGISVSAIKSRIRREGWK